MINLNPISLPVFGSQKPSRVQPTTPFQNNLRFSGTSEAEPIEPADPSSFSGWKGNIRKNNPWMRVALDFMGFSRNSAYDLQEIGRKFAFGTDNYPKSLSMADYYFERSLKLSTDAKPYKAHTKKNMGEWLFTHFSNEEGVADIGSKYLTKALESNPDLRSAIVFGLMQYGHLPLKNGTTLKDEAKKLIMDDQSIKTNPFSALTLLKRHFPEDLTAIEKTLERTAETADKTEIHKIVADTYYSQIKFPAIMDTHYKNVSLPKIYTKALKHYELYLETLEKFDPKETPEILYRLAFLNHRFPPENSSNELEERLKIKVQVYLGIAKQYNEEWGVLGVSPLRPHDKVNAGDLALAMHSLPKGTPLPFLEEMSSS